MTSAVAKRSDAAAKMVEATAKGRALMGGTTAMRAAGRTYLPQFPAESETAYRERLNLSWLFNGYRKTVKDMTGRVFSKSVEVLDPPGNLETWLDNVDMQGRDLSTFAREVFEDGIQAGVSYLWVDAPPRQGTVTQAQAQAQNLRPYIVHLSVEDVLGWKAETVNNVMTLTQIRIMEKIPVQDPEDEFEQKTVEQVRVLDRTDAGVMVRLYRKTDKEDWALTDEPYMTGLSDITVAPFYANRCGFFAGEPLLDDLADVNIAHWQSQSDQRNILHYARVPVLFASGVNADDKITIAAGMVTTASDPTARMAWVEHSGQAIGAGRQDLKDLEFQMEAYGLQLLVTKPQQSATGEALDASKETSTLAMTADQLKDALEQAIGWMCAYGGLGDVVPEVEVNKEFGVTTMTAQEATVLLQAVNTGNISKETFLKELVRRGMIDATDPADEIDRIDAEGGGMMDRTNGGQ